MATGNPTPGEISKAAERLGRVLTDAQAKGLAVYLGLLETWNRRTNLVGPRTWDAMLSELVADSWHLADLLAGLTAKASFAGPAELASPAASVGPASLGGLLPPSPVVLDFGAGAGIPGIPLRLFWPQGRYVLVEPRAKRAAFLRQCAAMMRLAGTEVFEGRVEALREQADLCLSRAFRPWREFLGIAEGFGRDGGAAPAVVFANEAEPDRALPAGYRLAASKAYPSRGGTGYLWVFAPESAGA